MISPRSPASPSLHCCHCGSELLRPCCAVSAAISEPYNPDAKIERDAARRPPLHERIESYLNDPMEAWCGTHNRPWNECMGGSN